MYIIFLEINIIQMEYKLADVSMHHFLVLDREKFPYLSTYPFQRGFKDHNLY